MRRFVTASPPFGATEFNVSVMNNKLDINITDDKSLINACDYLHDASFDLDMIEYDKKNGICKLKFEREYFENESLRTYKPKLLFFQKVFYPLISSEMILESIKSLNIHDTAKIGIFTFNECQVKQSKYQLQFCENMEISLEFKDKPIGSLKDLELLNKKGSFWSLKNPFSKTKER